MHLDFTKMMQQQTLQLLLDYGTDLDIKQSDNKSGREELKNFQKDYMNVKDKVPNYDEIVEIIDRLGNPKIGSNELVAPDFR